MPGGLSFDQHAEQILDCATGGMGMSRDVGLPVFARTFAENAQQLLTPDPGYAVLLFDYLFWGGSNGRPRQLIAPRLHVLDYVAAVKHVQARP
eukprot:1158396-Pelagomonas_calceolata.AAC.7